MTDPAVKYFDMLKLSLESLKTRTLEGVNSADRTLVNDDKRIREEYERKRAELETGYQNKISGLRNSYETERMSTLIASLELMATEVRQRSDWALNPQEARKNLDQELKDAQISIDMYNLIDTRRLPDQKRLEINQRFVKAKDVKKRYEDSLSTQKKISETADAGAFVIDIGPDTYLYPTLKFNDLQINPSLMVNLLEYCMVSCDKSGVSYSLPERENEFLRIRVEQGKRKNLIEMLLSGQPERFKEANLRFIVLNDRDYLLNPPEEKVHEEKSEEGIETRASVIEQGREYTEGEVMEMLGIPSRQFFKIQELKEKTGVTGRKDKRVMTIQDIKRGEYQRRVNVKLFTAEDIEKLRRYKER